MRRKCPAMSTTFLHKKCLRWHFGGGGKILTSPTPCYCLAGGDPLDQKAGPTGVKHRGFFNISGFFPAGGNPSPLRPPSGSLSNLPPPSHCPPRSLDSCLRTTGAGQWGRPLCLAPPIHEHLRKVQPPDHIRRMSAPLYSDGAIDSFNTWRPLFPLFREWRVGWGCWSPPSVGCPTWASPAWREAGLGIFLGRFGVGGGGGR